MPLEKSTYLVNYKKMDMFLLKLNNLHITEVSCFSILKFLFLLFRIIRLEQLQFLFLEVFKQSFFYYMMIVSI